MKFHAFLSVFGLSLLLLAANVSAAEYYVSPGGSDNSTGSVYAPWRTIQYGVKRMSSGDTLIIRSGTYNETITIQKAKTTIKSYPGETVVIDGQEKLPNSFYGALITIAATDVTVDGLQLYRSKSRGLQISPGAHRSRCSNLKISYCWLGGFCIPSTSNRPTDVVLEKSEVFRNERRYHYYRNPSLRPDPRWNYGGPWGANVSIISSLRPIIRDCKIYESYYEGLGLYNDTDSGLIENNQIWGNSVTQVYLSSSRLCTVRNNIIYGSASWNGGSSALGAAGVWLGGESWAASSNKDYGHRVYGNYIANSRRSIWIAGQSNAETRNSYIFNNVLVEALSDTTTSNGINIQVQSASSGTGNVIKNNAILQTKPQIDSIGSSNRAMFQNNLWSQAPSSYARGTGDSISNFYLFKNFSSGKIYGGSLKQADFSLTSSSLSKDKGTWLTTVNMPYGAVNTTNITLANAGYFHGDEKIKFADGKTATIQSITGNTLTVYPAISVANGVGLSLYNYTSTWPNVGPWMYTASSSSVRLAPPTALQVLE